MANQILKKPAFGIVTRALAILAFLSFVGAPNFAQQPTNPGDDPCTTRQKYLKAQAAADAADSAYKGTAEPDWENLNIPAFLSGRYLPGEESDTREERLTNFLKELKSTLADYKRDTSGLTLQEARSQAENAHNQEFELKNRWQQKQVNLVAGQNRVQQLEAELKGMGTGGVDAQKVQQIKQNEKTLQEQGQKVKAILGLDDEAGNKDPYIMFTAHYEVNDPKHKEFHTPEIEQKKKELDAVLKSQTSNGDDIRKAENALDAATESARQQAKTLMAAYDKTEKKIEELGGDDLEGATQNRTRKEQELQQARTTLKNLQVQSPTQGEVDKARQAAENADSKVLKIKQVGTMETLLPQVEPWIKARLERNESDKELAQAKENYDIAIKAKDALLDKAKAKLQDEQERISRISASVQGTDKDEAYYQKLSQMTLHARATYELILMSLIDFDCYPDVRNFMDGIKVRMTRLDTLHDNLIKQASTVTPSKPRPKPPVVVAKNPLLKKPVAAKPAATMWVCDGPVLGKSTRFNMSANNATFHYQSDDRTGEGTIQWSGVPLTIREGDTVTLTMTATGTGYASAGGCFNLNCYDTPKAEGPDWDNGCASIPGNDRSSPTPNLHMVFKFTPQNDEPYIQAVVAMNEGYTCDVVWKYRKKSGL